MVAPTTSTSPAQLSDADRLAQVARLAAHEREATVALVAHLAELDARRLYLAEGCASLFTYCTQVLHLSEHAAYGRIEAARTARRYPLLLERLAEGSVTLTTVTRLAPHLTADTHRDLLDRARHKSRQGGRCAERGGLEFHHVQPYAAGGEATADDIELRCRAHIQHEAAQRYGPWGPSLVREPARVYATARRAPAPGRTRFGPSWPSAGRPP